jgi:hypothetical protein
VQAERQDEVAVVMAGDRHGEVVVDTLFQLVQDRKSERGGEVHLCLPHRVGGGRNQGMNGHGSGMIIEPGPTSIPLKPQDWI